jgi:hypothetical protein
VKSIFSQPASELDGEAHGSFAVQVMSDDERSNHSYSARGCAKQPNMHPPHHRNLLRHPECAVGPIQDFEYSRHLIGNVIQLAV